MCDLSEEDVVSQEGGERGQCVRKLFPKPIHILLLPTQLQPHSRAARGDDGDAQGGDNYFHYNYNNTNNNNDNDYDNTNIDMNNNNIDNNNDINK